MYPNGWGSRVYPNCRGSRVYPDGWDSWVYANGWGSRVRPGWGGRCARTLPSKLALPACSSRYALAAWVLPSRLVLHACGSGFALTTIKWIHLLQLNEFNHLALPRQQLNEFIHFNWMNPFILHCKNLWIHCMNSLLNDFIYSKITIKWIHLLQLNEFIYFALQKSTNSNIKWIHY